MIKVLDDGFVNLVDAYGSDTSIVQAARISYGDGTKTPSEDTTLIRFLMRHHHTTPFEMCMMKFHIRCPMDVWRQWIRHRTAHVNEYSTRYSEAIDSAHKTDPSEWREQATTNRQGSGDFLPIAVGQKLSESEGNLLAAIRLTYENRLTIGVAREQARKDLPLSTYTEAYWFIDLHNLFNFLRLRLAPDAQLEIRQYAEAVAYYTKEQFPIAWQAFEDYTLNAMTFSAKELEQLEQLIHFSEYRPVLKGREEEEFRAKLKELRDGKKDS